MARPEGQWMPLYWGDYLKKTARFTLAHHGAYMLLMAEYWTMAKALPADPDEQALIVRIPTKDWLRLRPKIAEKFDEKDGLWHHERIEIELAKAAANYAARAKAGAEGAAKRWQKDGKAIVQPEMGQCQNDAPSPSPLPSENRKEESRKILEGVSRGLTGKKNLPANEVKAIWQSGICREAERTMPAAEYQAWLVGFANDERWAKDIAEQIDGRLRAAKARKVA